MDSDSKIIFLFRKVWKKQILFFFFFFSFFELIKSKYYDFYASFDGCLPIDNCQFKTYPDLVKGFIKGLGPYCDNEKSLSQNYLDCADKYFECGYLNLYFVKNSSILNQNEGVNILNGLDISDLSSEALKSLNVPDNIIGKLSPFFGIKGNDAYNKLEIEKIRLSSEEANILLEIFNNEKEKKLKEKFSKIKENFTNYEEIYKEMPFEIRTALFSQFNIYGEIPQNYQQYILDNKWSELSDKIKENKFPSNLKNGETPKNSLRKNLDAYLTLSAKSTDSKIQNSHIRGVFIIDLTNPFKQELKKYESYINTIKQFLKEFFNHEKCETCKNKDIHDYAILAYRNESIILSNFKDSLNTTLESLDKIIIPDSYGIDTRPRNTGAALEHGVWLFTNETLSFDKLKTIILFTNGESQDSTERIPPFLKDYSINLAIVDLSLQENSNLFNLAEGSYNYINFNFTRNEDIPEKYNKTLHCLDKQVANIFAYQNIHLQIGSNYRNSTIDHNNTVFFQAVRPSNKNLKISLNLNTFPEENHLAMFTSFDYPFPDYYTSNHVHEGTNYSPLKYIIIGKEDENIKNFELEQKVYFALVGANSDFGLKIEECDPKDCPVGSNIDENHYPFPKWIIVILIIIASLLSLYFIWYLVRCYRKKDSEDDIEQGFSQYKNIKN